MTDTRKEALKHVSYIHYQVRFRKDKDKTQLQALIDLGCEINTIYPSFTKRLGLPIRPTDVRVEKIDGNTLNTHEMVVTAFLVMNKANQVKFFEKTFLMANISLEIVFKMLSLTPSNADIDFLGWKL